MLFASISAVFALIMGNFARYNIPKGWQLLRIGWLAIQTNAGQDDARKNVERRRMIDEGTRFFLGGLGWFLGGIVAAIATVIFAIAALQFSGIFPLLDLLS